MKVYKYLLLTAIVAIGAISASAQSLSPYSKYGYGLLNDNATSMQRSMGGVGYAMNGGRQINVMNPASYAAIDSLTFLWDFGLDLTQLWSKEPGGSGKSTGGGLDYLTMQFPLGKYMGGSVGLMPYSSVGYSFGNEIVHGTDSRVGNGGINQLYAGVSARPFNNFSVGVNISYMFGTLINDIYAITTAGNQSLFERVMRVRDWNANIGALYTFNVGKNDKLSLGLVYTPKKTLHGDTWGSYYDISQDTEAQYTDTISLKNNFYTANSFGGGINYLHDNRLMVELDFTYQDWSKAKFKQIENFEETTFSNRWKVNAGVQYTPNPRGNYLKRINYRLGGYFNRDYVMIDNNHIKDYGVSVGFGLPTPGSKTLINLGFEYKHRNAYPANLVTEDYFNITLGVNFNEMWFWKNKIK